MTDYKMDLQLMIARNEKINNDNINIKNRFDDINYKMISYLLKKDLDDDYKLIDNDKMADNREYLYNINDINKGFYNNEYFIRVIKEYLQIMMVYNRMYDSWGDFNHISWILLHPYKSMKIKYYSYFKTDNEVEKEMKQKEFKIKVLINSVLINTKTYKRFYNNRLKFIEAYNINDIEHKFTYLI